MLEKTLIKYINEEKFIVSVVVLLIPIYHAKGKGVTLSVVSCTDISPIASELAEKLQLNTREISLILKELYYIIIEICIKHSKKFTYIRKTSRPTSESSSKELNLSLY